MKRVLLSAALILGIMVAFCMPLNNTALASQNGTVKKVMIDPGHGGRDSGAVGNGLKEKDQTLRIAQKVNSYLQNSYVVDTKLTRSIDTDVSLNARTAMSKSWGADYFFSIHINSGGGTGYEDYTYTRSLSQSPSVNEQSKEIQNVIHNEVNKVLALYGVRDRGSKEANFHVLRETEVPSILTELMFIDTPSDANLLKNEKFINDISFAYSEGIAKALNLPAIGGSSKPDTSLPLENPNTPSATVPSIKTVYETTANLNVRENAGTNYRVLTNAKQGTQVTITKTKKVGNSMWGYGSVNKKNGWMSMTYLKVVPSKPNTPKLPVTQVSNKVYTTTDNLNVRANAGTAYKVITNAKKGTKVTITKTQKVGSTVWGYGTVNKKSGWMSMNYMKAVTTTPPATPKPPVTQASNKVYTTTDNLNVRANAGTAYKVITNAKKGTKVTITKTQKVGSTVWGYGSVNKKSGWMSMNYMKAATAMPKPIVTQTSNKVYTTTDNLNVRANAGTAYKVITNAKKGTKVTITKTRKVGSTVWGYGSVNKKSGWMSMTYLTTTSTKPTASKKPVVSQASNKVYTTTANLNVRTNAGTNFKVLTTAKKGTKIVITKTKKVGNVVWGYGTANKKSGWMSMKYMR